MPCIPNISKGLILWKTLTRHEIVIAVCQLKCSEYRMPVKVTGQGVQRAPPGSLAVCVPCEACPLRGRPHQTKLTNVNSKLEGEEVVHEVWRLGDCASYGCVFMGAEQCQQGQYFRTRSRYYRESASRCHGCRAKHGHRRTERSPYQRTRILSIQQH